MTLRTIKTGAQPNDGTGDNLRTGAQIINENFAELDQRAAQASAQLSSIETGATKNRPDAELLDRANHTGADKRVIVSAGSIDDVKTPGLYAVFGANSTALPGAPVLDGVPRVNAILDVLTIGKPEGDPLYTLRQVWRAPGKGGQVWERGHAADGWGAWRMVLMQGDFGLGAKADATFQGTNLNPDTYRTGGYVVGQFNISPHGLVTGVLITQAGSNTTVCSQQFYDWANGRQYSRAMQSNTWTEWVAFVVRGDYGLGARFLPELPGNTLNGAEASGLYKWTNLNTGAPAVRQGELINLMGGPNYGFQLAGSHESDELWWRRKTATWQPWKKVALDGTYLSRNTSLNGVITDLNSVTNRQVLWVDSSVLNSPVSGDWYVEVLALEEGGSYGGYVLQRATSLGPDAPVYVRRRIAGTWYGWTQQEGQTSPRLSNMNVFTGGGVFRFDPSTAGIPVPNIWGTCQTTMFDSVNWTQMAITTDGSIMWTRGCVNGGVQPWVRQTPEFVSNANGSAIKYADGTMICWFESASRGIAGAANGSIFTSQQYFYTFPVPFVTFPIVHWSTGSSSNGVCWANHEWSNTTQTVGRINAAISGIDGYPRYMAIGRWR
ncbi:hypothetical protein LGQ10_12930 [Pseudomonas sp. L5B5]|uniref:hypothetical protein n=1 Tax=Pseudomonas sp. L5B5 TaxID=2883205 RepID=UPI001CFB4939|nr:hypothetical protein [Pseudomonas sp. L5B5]UCZ87154.1 hypothetical protein LGQ10_12930 [Pseudomonas sp. L5B5]